MIEPEIYIKYLWNSPKNPKMYIRGVEESGSTNSGFAKILNKKVWCEPAQTWPCLILSNKIDLFCNRFEDYLFADLYAYCVSHPDRTGSHQ